MVGYSPPGFVPSSIVSSIVDIPKYLVSKLMNEKKMTRPGKDQRPIKSKHLGYKCYVFVSSVFPATFPETNRGRC